MAEEEECPLACAIDFGTTFSGFSFVYKSDPKQVYIRNDWGAGAGSTKTPTSLLIKPDETFEIGYDAIKTFNSMSNKPDKLKKSRYFDRFKMELYYRGGQLSKATQIKDHLGKSMSALDVFGMVLKELKKHCLNKIRSQTTGNIDEERIMWVVTVPAIWTDAAKQFMKEAAVKGSLVQEPTSKRLKIALEPEAASICCLKLPITQSTFSSKSPEMKPGTQYMIIDAGGGTLDITVHEILGNAELAEIHIASGGDIGGAKIDQDFLTLIDDIFENPFTKDLKAKRPTVYVDFLSNFEKSKNEFCADKETFNVQINSGLVEYYSDTFPKSKELRKSIKKKFEDEGVSWNAGTLMIPTETIKQKVFERTVSAIVKHVRELLQKEKLRDVKVLLMVGGLSCLKILQTEMKNSFGKNYKIVIPDDARSVIVRGAAYFGLEENTIRRRISRMTYGIRVLETHGDQTIENAFSVFVEMGTEIDVTSVVKKQYNSPTEDAQAIVLDFYATTETTARYTTDPGMTQIGTMTLDLPGKGKERQIEVIMRFGGTCIEVEGRDISTKKFVKASLDCLSTEAEG